MRNGPLVSSDCSKVYAAVYWFVTLNISLYIAVLVFVSHTFSFQFLVFPAVAFFFCSSVLMHIKQ